MIKRLCCLLLCGLLLPVAALAIDAPSLENMVVGPALLEKWAGEGHRVTLDFGLDLQGYMGIAKAQRTLLQGLLAEIAVSYTSQALPQGEWERLILSGPRGDLLDLSLARQQGQQWIWGPQLDPALTAPEGEPVLEALLSSVVRIDALGKGEAAGEAWADFVQAHPPLGSPEEGYAYLLEGEAGLQAARAFLGLLRLGQPLDSLQPLLFTDLDFTEPVSLYWTEDDQGRLLTARLVTAGSWRGEEAWAVSFSLKGAYRKGTQTLDLTGSLTRGEDALEVTLGCRDTLDKQTARRQLRFRLEGKLDGYRQALDLRQTDTNTYALIEGELSEKLTRTLTFTSEDKRPEAQNAGNSAWAGTLQEKATWLTGDRDLQAEGTLSIAVTRMGDELLTLDLPFALSTGAGQDFAPPREALAVDLSEPGDARQVAEMGEGLWRHLAQTWAQGLDAATLELLAP